MKFFLNIQGYGDFSSSFNFEIDKEKNFFEFDDFYFEIISFNKSSVSIYFEDLKLFYFDIERSKYIYSDEEILDINFNTKYILSTAKFEELTEGYYIEIQEEYKKNLTLNIFQPSEIISYELNQLKPNMNKIEKLLFYPENIKNIDVDKIIDFYLVTETENKKSILNLLIKNNKTPFDKFYKEVRKDGKVDTLKYLLMVFSSYYPQPEPRVYYYILYQLEKSLNNQKTIKNIVDELDKLIEDESLNIIYDNINKLYPKSIFVTKKKVINEIYDSIISMKYHLNSFGYLKVSISDKLFYEYVPNKSLTRPIDDDFYFDYYIKIFFYIKNKINNGKSFYEVFEKLTKSYELIYNIRNTFENKKTNKHIMNLFMKDFGRMEFENHINYIISDMANYLSNQRIEYYLDNKSKHTFIKKIFNKK